MKERIAEFLGTRKGHDLLLVTSLVLLGVVAFGLGRMSVVPAEGGGPVVVRLATSTVAQVAASVPARADSIAAAPTVSAAPQTTGQYVASKNGSVYHLPWCSGAQRIKEENKVWFTTKAEAEAAGLRPAANCKGL